MDLPCCLTVVMIALAMSREAPPCRVDRPTNVSRRDPVLRVELNIQRERVAVVINENVVRRANLDETPINDGDTIEIITMVGGG